MVAGCPSARPARHVQATSGPQQASLRVCVCGGAVPDTQSCPPASDGSAPRATAPWETRCLQTCPWRLAFYPGQLQVQLAKVPAHRP